MGRWIRQKLSESLTAALEPPDLGGWSARTTFDRIECDAPSRPRLVVVLILVLMLFLWLLSWSRHLDGHL